MSDNNVVLGGYAAKQCPRCVYNDAAARLGKMPPKREVSDDTLARMAAGVEFESRINNALRNTPDAVVFSGDESTFEGRKQRMADTVAAIKSDAPLIVNGRLPNVGPRSGAPDLLVRIGDGYVPVDVKNHQTVGFRTDKETGAPSEKYTALVSHFQSPAVIEDVAGLSEEINEDDGLQLAHYTRMLQDLGYHAGNEFLIGGIIGSSDLSEVLNDDYAIVWTDLTAPAANKTTYSASDPKHRANRSLLERYDYEFDYRVKMAAQALAGEPGTSPHHTGWCKDCGWLDYCRSIADDASFEIRTELPSWRQWQLLWADGIRTLDQLAAQDPQVPPTWWAERDTATKKDPENSKTARKRWTHLVHRARMTLAGQQYKLHTVETHPKDISADLTWDNVEIPEAGIEIDFDIEHDTSGDMHVYMWGLQIRDGQDNETVRFEPVESYEVPLNDEKANQLAEQFAAKIHQILDDAGDSTVAIFHWSHPEKSRTRRYPAVQEVLERVRAEARMIDLRPWVTENLFSISGYSIKDIAPMFGFQWAVENTHDLEAMVGKARSTDPQESYEGIDWLHRYNGSDVAAQAAIRDGIRAAKTAALGGSNLSESVTDQKVLSMTTHEPSPYTTPEECLDSFSGSNAIDETVIAAFVDFFNSEDGQAYLNEPPNFWSILEHGRRSAAKDDDSSGKVKNEDSSYEIRVTKFLRWLLNPRSNHKLGNYFLTRFLQLLKATDSEGKPTSVDYPASIWSENNDVRIKDETKDSRADITFVREEHGKVTHTLTIENKTESGIHLKNNQDLSQLEIDRQSIINDDRYRPAINTFVLLAPSDYDHLKSNLWTPEWQRIDFTQLIEILVKMISYARANNNKVTSDGLFHYNYHAEKLIFDFLWDIQHTLEYKRTKAFTELEGRLSEEQGRALGIGSQEQNADDDSEQRRKLVQKNRKAVFEKLHIPDASYQQFETLVEKLRLNHKNPGIMLLVDRLIEYFADHPITTKSGGVIEVSKKMQRKGSTGQTIQFDLGKLHLDIAGSKDKEEFPTTAWTSAVPFRDTLTDLKKRIRGTATSLKDETLFKAWADTFRNEIRDWFNNVCKSAVQADGWDPTYKPENKYDKIAWEHSDFTTKVNDNNCEPQLSLGDPVEFQCAHSGKLQRLRGTIFIVNQGNYDILVDKKTFYQNVPHADVKRNFDTASEIGREHKEYVVDPRIWPSDLYDKEWAATIPAKGRNGH